MPENPKTRWCRCTACVREHPDSFRGKPWHDSYRYYNHLKPSDLDSLAGDNSQSIEEQSNAFFLSTVLDEGPDLDIVKSRTSDPKAPLPTPSETAVTSYIVDGIARIRETASSPSASKEDKREAHVSTSRALERLDRIQTRLQELEPMLGTPSKAALEKVEDALPALFNKIGKVTRSTPSIEARRAVVMTQLQNAHARVTELRHLFPREPDTRPIFYDCSESVR